MNEPLRYLYNESYLEKVVNSCNDFPGGLLGPHITQRGLVISVFNPQARHIQIIDRNNGRVFDCSPVTDNGLYGALIGSNTTIDYFLRIFPYYGEPYDTEDIYNFPVQTTTQTGYLFGNGVNYNIYEWLGAHLKTIKGISGVLFTVWAPNAQRVSIVGNFNNWDGRMHQMNRVHDVGIFELFVPYMEAGEIYKYEIKTPEGLPILKTDPFGNYQQLRPDTASIVADLSSYSWGDNSWIEKRSTDNTFEKPMAIYEMHPGSWRKAGVNKDEFMNYRDIAPVLADYIKEMGYTHIELMGIAEHPFDGSWGYQVTGYYAPTSRYGTPEDFMYFVDYMHRNGIYVLLDWVPAHFPKDAHGLGRFDGTCLFEHPDPRRGEHPQWGTYIFNYGKSEVKNFLISNALFWVEKFHIDGLRVDAVASMLYLDYGRENGNWLPNINGGNENLEAMEFLKHLNSIMDKRNPGALVIAEESTAWANITKPPTENGLGFTYKWNMGWMNDFLSYVSTDPLYKKFQHDQLTFSMVYAYSEKFILVLSHDEVVYGKCSMLNKMPGDMPQKYSNLRTTYGFMFAHPGKKLMFMGQDYGQNDEWKDTMELDWFLLDEEPHKQMQQYVKDLLHLYKNEPAFYQQDYNEDGFEWISKDDRENSQVSFVRKTSSGKGNLLFICNFTPVERLHFPVGVPCSGVYTNIFTSDNEKYGGTGLCKSQTLTAQKIEHDSRDYSIQYDMPPLSITVFKYDYVDDKKIEAERKLAEEKRIEQEKKLAEKKMLEEQREQEKVERLAQLRQREEERKQAEQTRVDEERKQTEKAVEEKKKLQRKATKRVDTKPATKATSKATAEKPATKTTAKATAEKPATKTTAKATAEKPATKTAAKATAEKPATKTTAKTTAEKPATKTTAKTTAEKPATKTTTKATAEKSVTKTTAKATAEKSAAKTTAKATAEKPATKTTAK
ncbi:MAG TPA: 1,4-alpha-glucan branching protein GlgB, partial [Clostridiales bacterium]|nr:1,4-alpha-glucan branching protein GlgB [Clostridiales bacterium]